MNWRDDILREAAGGPRAQCVTTTIYIRNPAKIERLGKARRTLCKGGCGRRVWGDYCRKCRKKGRA